MERRGDRGRAPRRPGHRPTLAGRHRADVHQPVRARTAGQVVQGGPRVEARLLSVVHLDVHATPGHRPTRRPTGRVLGLRVPDHYSDPIRTMSRGLARAVARNGAGQPRRHTCPQSPP
ncbi:hypothetical protein SGUI_1490 [Serinicoccus hydrothermalis]|uniref:Uncharacterized protein n=1 Tax=Serinicoccus hydrothermalis TaxID=1758689 RepID=A0A1B1NBT4_9MICO|nr:hypothetical protein SGUI_1490 [Serinicoccus hydrothermalis]